MPLIELDSVTKTFTQRRWRGAARTTSAVRELSFTVEPGELVGYIGPNGAGKSTTIKMMTGILVPTSGRLRVAGLDPSRDRVALARRLGVVFGQRTTLWWDLPLKDSFAMLRHLYRVEQGRHRRNLDRYVELLDLGPLLGTPVRQLSLGQRMRGDLVAALLHDPEIVYLDEPTIGLDVISKDVVRTFLAENNKEQGTCIVLTTHDLDDIERLCSRVVVIDGGQLVFDGSLEQMRSELGGRRQVVVDFEDADQRIELTGVSVDRVEGRRQWLSLPAGGTVADIVTQLVSEHPVVDFSVHEPDIESVIRSLYLRSAMSGGALPERVRTRDVHTAPQLRDR